MHKAAVVVVLLLAIVGALALRAARTRGEPAAKSLVTQALPSDVYPTEPALIGRRASFSIPIRNSRSTIMWIAGTELTCSCITITSIPVQLQPGEEAIITAEFDPAPFAFSSVVQLTVRADAAGPITEHALLHDAPQAPFAGWPANAAARQSGSSLVIPFAPEYMSAGVVKDVSAFVAGSQTPVLTRLEGGSIVIEDANKSLDLVVHFSGDGSATWSGPVVVAGS